MPIKCSVKLETLPSLEMRQYGQLILVNFLSQCFPPTLTKTYGTPPNLVTFTFEVSARQEVLTKSMLTAPKSAKPIRPTTISIDVPTNITSHDPMDLLVNHRNFMIAAHTEEIAIFSESLDIRDSFTLKKSDPTIQIEFDAMSILTDTEGRLNMHLWPMYLVCTVLYRVQAGNGDVNVLG